MVLTIGFLPSKRRPLLGHQIMLRAYINLRVHLSVLNFTGREMISDASHSEIADAGRQAPIPSDYLSIDGVAVAMLPTNHYRTTGRVAG